MAFFSWRRRSRRASAVPRARLTLEALESRIVPYTNTGNAWPNPQLITVSFVPDGTVLGQSIIGPIYSNLFATMDAKFGSPAKWENVMLQAAQTWAQQTNLNFTVISDDGAATGSGNYQQGDPNMGDIRIGGYNFATNTVLAWTMMPPPVNNYSIAGDINFNTGMSFNIGSTYDLFTVATHEFGHALGLGESITTSAAVMWASYNGIKRSLNADDIAGIRNIYSSNNPRTQVDFDNTFATANNLTSQINPTALTALVTGQDITTTSQQNYYTFTAPSGSSSTLTVTVQSSGLSLLTPTLTVYAANETTVLGSANGAGQYGTTLTVTVNNVTPGEQFYVEVAGADASAFSTGAYALTLNLGSGSSPAVPLPNTQVLNGNPLSGGGGEAEFAPGSNSQGIPSGAFVLGAAPGSLAVPGQALASSSAPISRVRPEQQPATVQIASGNGGITPEILDVGGSNEPSMILAPVLFRLGVAPVCSGPSLWTSAGAAAEAGGTNQVDSELPQGLFGSGSDPDAALPPEAAPPAAPQAESLPVGSQPSAQPQTELERGARDACFAQQPFAPETAAAWDVPRRSQAADETALDPAAVLAGLLVLGGFIGMEPEERRFRRGREQVSREASS